MDPYSTYTFMAFLVDELDEQQGIPALLMLTEGY